MKKLIFIIYILFTTLFGEVIDSKQHKSTIYPELVGLGGVPSINIEYNINDYSIRAGIGMIIMQAIIHPIAIYRTYGINEIGLGLMYMDDGTGQRLSIGTMGTYNLKIKWNKRIFTRFGISGGYNKSFFGHSNSGFGILPTIGFGFNFL